ncbi:MAG: hypothetical protein LBF16_00570 [Pseudomonadales bacterium]|jgi:hypothetical protein|nr:hypothetical protein [Pseudomonadales bacterium]
MSLLLYFFKNGMLSFAILSSTYPAYDTNGANLSSGYSIVSTGKGNQQNHNTPAQSAAAASPRLRRINACRGDSVYSAAR